MAKAKREHARTAADLDLSRGRCEALEEEAAGLHATLVAMEAERDSLSVQLEQREQAHTTHRKALAEHLDSELEALRPQLSSVTEQLGKAQVRIWVLTDGPWIHCTGFADWCRYMGFDCTVD